MSCDVKSFFTLYFKELERRKIPYVILHSYESMPEKISSDIDYAVPEEHLAGLTAIQIKLARANGWALVQTLRHGVFAYYAILVNLDNPAEGLRLDACSSYARARRLLVPAEVLLANRTAYRGIHVPEPSAEFAYVVAKLFDAKKKSPADYLPRLKMLFDRDPEKARRRFHEIFGDTGRTLEEWFAASPEEWRVLGPIMMRRKGFTLPLLAREGLRVVRRIARPTGVTLAFLGSPGSGKTTLLATVQTQLLACFRRQYASHFQPAVLAKRISDAGALKPVPKGAVLSWLRVLRYFTAYWLGWIGVVQPSKVRSTLLLFDNSFEDLVVDQERFGLTGASALARLLVPFLPKADRTFILAAPAPVLYSRRSELSLEELERQQAALLKLAETRPSHVVVSADDTPAEVARKVCREVVVFMAAREEKRAGVVH